MHDALPFIVIGVASGSLFGLAAVGLVLTFKATGVFNLAHGAIAAVAAYAFYDLHEGSGLPWPIAAVLTVVVVGVVGGVLVDRVAGAVSQARPILAITATVGLLLAIQGALTVRYGAATLTFPGYLPRGSIDVAGVDITYEQGCDIDRTVPPMELPTEEVFLDADGGEVFRRSGDSTRLLFFGPPSPDLPKRWSVRSTGTFTPEVSGPFQVTLIQAGRCRVSIDGRVVGSPRADAARPARTSRMKMNWRMRCIKRRGSSG